jgi:hypothetical protein
MMVPQNTRPSNNGRGVHIRRLGNHFVRAGLPPYVRMSTGRVLGAVASVQAVEVWGTCAAKIDHSPEMPLRSWCPRAL